MGKAIAFLSYGFHEVVLLLVRWSVGRRAKMAIRSGTPLKWRTLSDDFDKAGFLPAVSVLGPRWNCHALIATLSPVPVGEKLSVDLVGLADGSDSWSLVLYDERWATRKWVGSTTTSDTVVAWALPPGLYSLSLRVYTDSDDMQVPTVRIDRDNRVCGGRIAGEASRYRTHLQSIRNKSGLLYRLLHYYIFFHLKHGTKDANWLRRQFLPMGNPDTDWEYGYLDTGEQLRICLDAVHHRQYNTYVAFYNWASFPIDWCKIQALDWRSAPLVERVGYAVRRVRKVPATAGDNLVGHFEVMISKPTVIDT
jgi:uncharacterized protein DUF6208